MKLSNECWNILYDFHGQYIQATEELKIRTGSAFTYWGKRDTFNHMQSKMFELENRDFERAIALCKEYGRSIQKKSYELKFNQFKRGDYNSTKAYDFISELYSELRGTRRTNPDKIMLIKNSMEEMFPEKCDIKCATELFDIRVNHFNHELEMKKMEEEQEFLNILTGTIVVGYQQEKSLLEVLQEVNAKREEHENR